MFVDIETLILTYLYTLWLVLKQVLFSLSVPNMLCENRQAYMNKILYVHPMIMFFKQVKLVVILSYLILCVLLRVFGSTCIMISLYSYNVSCYV